MLVDIANRRVQSVERVQQAPSPSVAPRSWIVFHPRYERFLRRCGVTSAGAALELRGEIVCGHPDRHVARVELGAGSARRVVYLKREHVVGLRVRWKNRRAGFGWVSRSEREAVTLRRLEGAGLPGPQWLAYGEDGAGRAFLLVDELVGLSDVREVLGDTGLSPEERCELAERAGRAVADLHDAGFGTPELAAKHLFVGPSTGAVTLVDWQSAGPPGHLTDADRARQLAGLHASLADHLATSRERVRFAWAYLRAVRLSAPAGVRPPRFSTFVRSVIEQADRLRHRSSARDQRRPPAPRLVWLAGEAVCAVPEVADSWPTPAVCPPFYPDPAADGLPQTPEEWVTLPGGRRALLVRFATFDPPGRLVAAVRERPWRSPGATAARVLFHLQRHGVPAPELLAFGQLSRSAMRADSFVLYEPLPAAVPVAVRLTQLPGDRQTRRDLLHCCGAVLRGLHDAGCRPEPARGPLLVAAENVAVDSPFAVRLVKRLSPSARAADLRLFLRSDLPGLGRTDRLRVVRGYLGPDWSDRTARKTLLARVA
jgi:tRNA A-37 threonylcarbamoyl transferase component Bud32